MGQTLWKQFPLYDHYFLFRVDPIFKEFSHSEEQTGSHSKSFSFTRMVGFYFWYFFDGPFKDISLISSRSLKAFRSYVKEVFHYENESYLLYKTE